MALLRVLFHCGRAPLVLFVVVAHLVWHRGLVPFVARSVAWLAMVVDSKVTERQKDPSAAQESPRAVARQVSRLVEDFLLASPEDRKELLARAAESANRN